jgi:replicative DNA helicase
MSTERLILAALAQSEDFSKRVIGFIQPEYFETEESRAVFKEIHGYVTEFHSIPNRISLDSLLDRNQTLDDTRVSGAKEVLSDIFDIIPPDNRDFLMKTTEAWCRDRALFNAINQSIAIYQGEDKKLKVAAIPDLVKTALSVTFDASLGSDYFEDAASRWEYYTTPENKIPFRLEIMNEVTCGGVTRKSLNIIAAGINVGKSMSLIALAADYVRLGYSVLYISMEMSEEMVMQRMDANLLNTQMSNIVGLGQETFMSKVNALRTKPFGRFKAKEYPPSTCTALEIDRLLDDYEIMHGFVPDVVMVDYIQITASYKMQSSAGSYYYYKSVAEELRSIAVRRELVMWSVSQFNRGGMDNSDPSMGDIGESMGIPATADGMWAVIRSEDLDQIGQLAWKQLKSRYANKAVRTTFQTGVDVERQQFFDTAETAERSTRSTLGRAEARGIGATSPKDRFGKFKYGEKNGSAAAVA